MCAMPALAGIAGGKLGGKIGAVASGGLLGLAAHSMTKGKKKKEPVTA